MSFKNIFTTKKNKLDIKTVKIGGKKKGKNKSLTNSSLNFDTESLMTSSVENIDNESPIESFNLNSEMGLQTENVETNNVINTEDSIASEGSGFDIKNLEITLDPLLEDQSNKNITDENFSIPTESASNIEDFKNNNQPNVDENIFNGFDISSHINPETKDFEKEETPFSNDFTIQDSTPFTDERNTSSTSEDFATSFDELTKSVSNESLSPVTSWTEANYNIPSINQEDKKNNKSLTEKVLSFKNLPTKQQYTIFISSLVVGVLGMGSSIYLNKESSNEEANASAVTSTLWGDTLRLNSSFTGTLLGVKGSYAEMVKTWGQIETNKKELDVIIPELDNTRISEQMTSISTNFDKVASNVNSLKSQETVLKAGVEKVETIKNSIAALKYQLNKLGIVYLQSGATQNEIADIYSLNAAFDKLESSANSILTSENVTQEDLATLRSSKDSVANILAEIKDGSEQKNIRKLLPNTQHIFSKLSSEWLETIPSLFEIIQASDDLRKVKSLGKSNQQTMSQLSEQLRTLVNDLPGADETNTLANRYLLILSLILILGSLVALFYVYTNEKEKASIDARDEAEKQKTAIFKLINEISPIRDGILTQKATLEDGITFDIAKSVNETVESLSSVVKRIKSSSGSMEKRSSEIFELSESMIQKSENQASAITKAGSSVIQISRAINEIADKTKQTLETASLSAQATHKGAEQVKSSVTTMNTISENMEETVVLMKKVSDSSRQISEVIDLLSDITEETNILALNAAVQAAKAGEAGKGFKIVADSIQSLADNAAEATRRVGALVATVQTDIQSVGFSIDKTYTEIDKGVSQSVSAGNLLSEIDIINTKLSEIVASVTNDAKSSSDSAKEVAGEMQKILRITEETKESTTKTAESIKDIAEISSELNSSVQSFIVD